MEKGRETRSTIINLPLLLRVFLFFQKLEGDVSIPSATQSVAFLNLIWPSLTLSVIKPTRSVGSVNAFPSPSAVLSSSLTVSTSIGSSLPPPDDLTSELLLSVIIAGV